MKTCRFLGPRAALRAAEEAANPWRAAEAAREEAEQELAELLDELAALEEGGELDGAGRAALEEAARRAAERAGIPGAELA